MKKAVLILGIILFVVILLQSWAVGLIGVFLGAEDMAQGGLVGRIVALLFGGGAAFILAKPLVSLGIFTIGGLAGVLGGIVTGFYDLILWGAIALILAAMSYFVSRNIEQAEIKEDKVAA